MFLDEGQIGGAIVVLAAGRQDAGRRRQVTVQEGHVQGRQQLAHGEVAHAAEDGHVEGKAVILLVRGAHVSFANSGSIASMASDHAYFDCSVHRSVGLIKPEWSV